MANWIFIEEFDLKPPSEQALNLDFVTSFMPRIEDAQLVFYFGSGGHVDPRVLTFSSKDTCQNTYNNLKTKLRTEAQPSFIEAEPAFVEVD